MQSRPITALPEPTTEPPTDWTVPDPDGWYFRASIVEQLPALAELVREDLLDQRGLGREPAEQRCHADAGPPGDRRHRDVQTPLGERLARSRDGRAAQRRLSAAAHAAAAAPVTGDGVRITVNDAPSRGGAPAARVYDRDLQNLVNGLWAAGATAIAVNGQRITSTSAIREAGSSILVDFHPISPPYRLDAVGDPGTVQPRLAESPAGRRLQTLANTYGIRYDVSTAEDLRLPAGSAGTRYARTAAR